jgi:hypothetical protein
MLPIILTGSLKAGYAPVFRRLKRQWRFRDWSRRPIHSGVRSTVASDPQCLYSSNDSSVQAVLAATVLVGLRSKTSLDWQYMKFAIEHLPRAHATFRISPVEYEEARTWLSSAGLTSLIRTTETIGAIEAGFGVRLEQSDGAMQLKPGDEALLISLSFSVLLAWSQGNIVPLQDDWRCLLLKVQDPREDSAPVTLASSEGPGSSTS